MTIAHLRTYTIKEGQMDSWLGLWQNTLVPLMAKHGIKAETAWVNEDASQFVWIRSYGDDMEDIERKEASFYGCEWWLENVDMVRGHMTDRDIKLLKSFD